MFIKKVFPCVFVVLLFVNCKATKLTKVLSENIQSTFNRQQFTGMYVYDVKANKEVFNYQGDKYFTPASNVKIFTLFTGLTLLGDSIPALKYAVTKDTITIQGTGDPTFLHHHFKDSTALKIAQKYAKVNIITHNIEDKRYGPGWAWEDFDSYFSPERSAFPMYGNVLTIENEDTLTVQPVYFKNKLTITNDSFGRDEYRNTFYFREDRKGITEIPMRIDSTVMLNLWKQLLPNKIWNQKRTTLDLSEIAYSTPSDSVYKRMMEVSDNFLAEQILIVASSTLSDTLSSSRVRHHLLDTQLKDLKERPRWVDGSGLSRYNLFSPRSFVEVLIKLYSSIPQKRLFNLFPAGGVSGTLKNWYAGKNKPYVYAKTGSLGNNYNISGYVITTSGKVLAFSFMNNHFVKSTNTVRMQMQQMLEHLRDEY